MKRVLLFCIFTWLLRPDFLQGQTPEIFINEIVANNSQGIIDEFGDYSDWFELYNYGALPVDLEGFSLKDDPLDTVSWVFPQLQVAPGQYLLLYASGRDIFNTPVTWSTILDQENLWAYVVPNASTSSSWKSPGFDDSGWSLGKPGFGYGDQDDSTIVSQGTISIYLRARFTVNTLETVERALLHADYDDGFVAYLNGVEICRANIGTPGSAVAFDQTADNANHEAVMYNGGKPELFMIDNVKDLLVEGENVLAIEVHNAGAGSSDLTMIPFLTLGYNQFSGEPNHVALLDLPASSIHTNFKLSRQGEFLGLYDPTGNVVDSISFGIQKADISYGRSTQDSTTWGYFSETTPGERNSNASFSFAEQPGFSIQGGFYNGGQTIAINASNPSDSIYLTFDGTVPDESALLYTVPLLLDSTTVIRARTFADGKIPSEVVTQSYFIDEQINLPIISLVTNPDHFFSDESGIYVTGTNGRPGSCDKSVRNVNQDWERPVNIELYNLNGEAELNQVAGIKIFGGCSRTRYPQKSFSLFARSEYGRGSFDAQLFPDKEIYEFESFILRSSADDQRFTMLKDAFAQYVQIEHMDIDYQAYRPTVVFINGAYWGIHNMREKINEHYLTGNFHTDPEDVNILQSNASISHGSNVDYKSMIDFASVSNLNDANSYQFMNTRMDIDQYIDYQIANIYLAEVDWPGNNIKFWNSNSQYHHRWRWITYDRDQTFLSHRIQTNSLGLATATDAPGWPNPPWSTLLFRRLLLNDEFRDQFIQLYAYHLNITFHHDRINDILNQFRDRIDDEIPRHIEKWGGRVDPDMNESWTAGPTFNSVAQWEAKLMEIQAFASDRPYFAIQHLKQKFNLDGMSLLNLHSNDPQAGVIKLFNKELSANGYSGDHFTGSKVVLKAVSNSGYRFSHWTVASANQNFESNEAILEFIPEEAATITAHFEPGNAGSTPRIVINEINYNSPDERNSGDWVELFNNSNELVSLENWTLKDSNEEHTFVFPKDQEMAPHTFLVVCENVADFERLYPQVYNRIGDLNFKFSNAGEVIRLYDESDVLIDSVRYGDSDPWPRKADGEGPTLELIHPDKDNDVPQNWLAFYDFGTPGKSNSTITHIDENPLINELVDALNQNYPNPANLRTAVSYSISQDASVALKLVNMLGSTITIVESDQTEAGVHHVEVVTSDLSEGVYLYVLQVDGRQVDSKRMIVRH